MMLASLSLRSAMAAFSLVHEGETILAVDGWISARQRLVLHLL